MDSDTDEEESNESEELEFNDKEVKGQQEGQWANQYHFPLDPKQRKTHKKKFRNSIPPKGMTTNELKTEKLTPLGAKTTSHSDPAEQTSLANWISWPDVESLDSDPGESDSEYPAPKITTKGMKTTQIENHQPMKKVMLKKNTEDTLEEIILNQKDIKQADLELQSTKNQAPTNAADIPGTTSLDRES